MAEKKKRTRTFTEKERLEKYFYQLSKLIPEPPRNWAVNAKPCKWAKILEDRKDNPDATG
jgi:hypothetical protein